jgi:thiol-disulfide isomerase/thioredoxin
MKRLWLIAALSFAPLSSTMLCAQDPGQADRATLTRDITNLLRNGDLEEATKQIDELAAKGSDSRMLMSLRQNLAMECISKGRTEDAVLQANQIVESAFAALEKSNQPQTLATALMMTESIYRRAGQPALAEQTVDRALEWFANKEVSNELGMAKSQILRLKANQLRMAEKAEEALLLLREDLDSVKKRFAEERSSSVMAQHVLSGLGTLLSFTEGDAQEEVFQELQAFATQEMNDRPNRQVLAGYFNAANTYVSMLARGNPDQASTALDAVRNFIEDGAKKLEAAGDQPEQTEKMVKNFLSALERAEKSIEMGKRLNALVGQPAPKIDAMEWVNGPKLTAEDMAGKVILLDFWAVWCGPCIMTFPHLKHLDAEYGPKGLKVLGVTRQYNYQWDDEADKAARAETDVALEDELKMLEKFMASHELTHASIVTPKDSPMQMEYAVTGIPHAVIIDQKGIVRLIKVGSGEKNAKDIEEMIQSLLP